MLQTEALRRIAEKFQIVVRNTFHVQIEHDKGKYTNIWMLKHDEIKVQLFGNRGWFIIYDERGLSDLIEKLGKFDYKSDNDLSRMRELQKLMSKAKDRDGIFTDAGWKSGMAKIAVIRVVGTDMDITVRHGEYQTNVDAEMVAIKLAVSLYPGAEEIFSDCQPAVNDYNKIHDCKIIKWIDRSKNKEADALSNMRKVKS